MPPHRLSGRLSRLGDMRSSQATEHILSLASKTLDLMRDDGPLHIDVRADTDGDDMLIAVADDGFGMDEATRKSLLAGINCRHDGTCSKDEKGTGIALRNVSERLDRFYGYGSGLDIMSKPGEGTCVTMRLARAAVHE